MSDEAAMARKLRRATQMLLYQRHRKPGVKGWELRKSLGKDYSQIIDLLKGEFEKMGLTIKIISEVGELSKESSTDDLERARYYATLQNPLGLSETSTSGWRIDDLAVLAVIIAYITSKQGKAPRKEVENILKEKLSNWRVELSLDRFLKRGYLMEDEHGTLYLDWRTRAEIDQKTLTSLILAG